MAKSKPKRVCCLIVVHKGIKWRRALEVCIKNRNVYVHHFDRKGRKIAHISHHASGQQHIKKNNNYVLWTGGPTGKLEPMKFPKTAPSRVVGRETVTGMGWAVDRIMADLPSVSKGTTSQVLELPPELEADILYLQCSIVGTNEPSRDQVNGFPVIWRHRFTNGVTVEVEAVAVHQPR